MSTTMVAVAALGALVGVAGAGWCGAGPRAACRPASPGEARAVSLFDGGDPTCGLDQSHGSW